ncbi:uncharacterized protein MAM_00311 [Metarhizium album ARSEF 1941]|uniref:Uncharacterized protein n=1 Tax=Metarhizium album (strain ARSEF 1941) TaxID=1081103 RepID=A0A0B2X764_METAS|nr:uncharacterized protein MAM_00311 [Metarhizium album ARSEF 1941]KHO01310.1 hypothetical protein MAM_00311 [Metarhizium album ARSEF 1941]
MTAGAPQIASSVEERARSRGSRTAFYSPYLAASARGQSLDPIEERESTASFIDQEAELPEKDDLISESTPTTSHSSSDGAEPPEFRPRGSVVTTATSLASLACRRNSSPPADNQYEGSWIEADSDGEDDADGNTEDYNVGSLSPRPPRQSCSGMSSPATESGSKINMPNFWIVGHNLPHQKSHSVSGEFPRLHVRRQRSGKSLDMPVRPRTMNGPRKESVADTFKSGSLQTPCPDQCQGLKTLRRMQPLRTSTADSSLPTRLVKKLSHEPAINLATSPASNACSAFDEEDLHPVANRGSTKPQADLVRPPTLPEPLQTVQSWLNSSLQPYPWASKSDEAARAVPLPPDAIETLRVSVVCFPETMLLTSSLTVETIRSYAKKMRHPMPEVSSISGDASMQASRKSLWRKVVDYNKGPHPSNLKSTPRYSNVQNADSSLSEVDAPKPWAPIKNVFYHCSDYICDALYAHIVSYNYISALIARNPVPLVSNGRANSMSSRDQHQQDDIPKKAASLLGLAASAEAAARMSQFTRPVSSPLGEWNKEGIMTSSSSMPSSQDNALRVIQNGLLRCIARLVATAKLMAEDGAEEDGLADVEAEEADPLFMRCLCEIVRVVEEAS